MWGVKEADGKEENAQARATTESCQEKAEQIDEITRLPDKLFVPFPHISNSLGLECADSNPMMELKPIQMFPYPKMTCNMKP